jgi:adenosylcobinamide kinase/adenosylcobinamide-phosphate guanylyltransferase
MGRLTLITGGAASGKSSHALRLGAGFGPRILFIATCAPRDAEMLAKVARHQVQRPPGWTTVEATRRLADAFAPAFDGAAFDGPPFDGAIVDCLTLLISQLLIEDAADAEILLEVRSMCQAAKDAGYPVVLVTNEVGQGLVPEHSLGRRFRDLQGRANQLAAALADEVLLVVCGIPVRIKHAG